MDENKKKIFEERTNRHISLVQKYGNAIGKIGVLLPNVFLFDMEHHDSSKFESPEYEPYVELTWLHKQYKKNDHSKHMSEKLGRLIREATMHHIMTNPHHPEYWDDNFTSDMLNKADRDKSSGTLVSALKMPDWALAEMVCDWCAMSEELGSNPNKWADDNIGKRWLFSYNQIKKIYYFIDKLWGWVEKG